tara:strand:+ start:202 stop:543 length:342 start_codon:yes stop_codon:yes gene_type:complete
MYVKFKSIVEELIKNPSWDDTVKIAKTIAAACGSVELVNVGGNRLSGISKKAISAYLGRRVIEDLLSPRGEKLLKIYDDCREEMIEILVDFAKNHKFLVKDNCSKFCGHSITF